MRTPSSLQAIVVALGTAAALAACGGSGTPGSPDSAPLQLTLNFASSQPACTGGSADYTADSAPPDVVSATATLPTPFPGQGWRLSGTNRSDDLFVYVKCRLTGLPPQRAYKAGFSVEFLTDAPMGCIGVGGAPGEGVTLHAGATAQEPQTVLQGDGHYRVNLDRGNQSVGGSQSQALGHIGNTLSTCNQRQFASKTLQPAALLQATTDAQGGLWLHLGIDSGFEAYSQVHLRSAVLTLTPVVP
jgi:hypothetical protein